MDQKTVLKFVKDIEAMARALEKIAAAAVKIEQRLDTLTTEVGELKAAIEIKGG
jgi:peptidoglycan hydrolase CwlO-like protein